MAFPATKTADLGEVEVTEMFAIVCNEITEAEISEMFSPFEETVESPRDLQMTTTVDEFIAAQAKKNTKQATERDIKNVQRWLYDNKREPRVIENILPAHLNDYLSQLFIAIRKADGTNYEPSSLEALKNSIERHLKEKNYQTSLRDRVFAKCMSALTAKKMELKKQGHGNKPRKSMNITEDEEEKMYETGALGTTTPKSLQFTVFYNFGKMFGLRGRDEARQLKYGDIAVKTTTGGVKYLEFTERATKTRDGADLSNTRSTPPKIFASGGTRDPVEVYETFVQRRPATMLSPNSPFYLTAVPEKHLKGTTDEPWYYPRPMGEVTLGGLMKNAAQQAGIASRLTNHSIRKATVTTLSKAGVPPHKIMKITGHKNIQSIEQYDAELSEEEHQKISTLLEAGNKAASKQISPPTTTATNPMNEIQNMVESYSRANGATNTSSVMMQNPTIQSPFPSTYLTGNTFHNCTFHFGNFDLENQI